MGRCRFCGCRWTWVFLWKRLWIEMALLGSIQVRHCSLENHCSPEKHPARSHWIVWEEHSFLIPKLHFIPLSQLPQVLWAAFSLRCVLLKTSAKFYIPKPPWKHRLLLVPEKSTFCPTMSNTVYRWPVALRSANVFYKGLYSHNVFCWPCSQWEGYRWHGSYTTCECLWLWSKTWVSSLSFSDPSIGSTLKYSLVYGLSRERMTWRRLKASSSLSVLFLSHVTIMKPHTKFLPR